SPTNHSHPGAPAGSSADWTASSDASPSKGLPVQRNGATRCSIVDAKARTPGAGSDSDGPGSRIIAFDIGRRSAGMAFARYETVQHLILTENFVNKVHSTYKIRN